MLAQSCGGAGSYELHWNLACPDDPSTACAVRSARDCSLAGIDSVEVIASPHSGQARSFFACYTARDGPVGRGPALAAGETLLEVSGRSPGGQLVAGPVIVGADIPASGLVEVWVILPRAAPSDERTDKEDDGLIDRLDQTRQRSSDTAPER